MGIPAIVAIVAVIVGYLWYYTRAHRESLAAKRHIEALPRLSQVGPAADGAMVRADGVVRASQTLVSPISGLPCVAYRVRVTVDPYDVPNMSTFEDAQSVEFFLDRPGEPSVIVDGSFIRLDVRIEGFDTFDGATAERFFLSRGLPIRAVRNAKIEEMLVRVGARISIAGTLMFDGPTVPQGGMLHSADGGTQSHLYRDTGSATPRLAGNAQVPLVISSMG